MRFPLGEVLSQRTHRIQAVPFWRMLVLNRVLRDALTIIGVVHIVENPTVVPVDAELRAQFAQFSHVAYLAIRSRRRPVHEYAARGLPDLPPTIYLGQLTAQFFPPRPVRTSVARSAHHTLVDHLAHSPIESRALRTAPSDLLPR
ncbi:hypothetical protein C5E43_19135 [Nocardia cyriacigeorgica]|nr:hypothetical protein C5E43_19135 [Nocardia cyriacigeorgica]